MTPLHMIYIASIAGAVLFFVAGATTVALRVKARPAEDPAPDGELVQLRAAGAARSVELDSLRETVATRDADLSSMRATIATRDVELSKQRSVIAARDGALEKARSDLSTMQAAIDARDASLSTKQAAIDARDASLAKLQSAIAARDAQLAKLRAATDAASAEHDARLQAEARALRLTNELERLRADGSGASTALEVATARIAELERILDERTRSLRDLSTEAEQLKGKVRDAEGMHSEYVRLRTAAVDAEFLRSEIARLETELREMHVESLVGRPRLVRGSVQPRSSSARTIGESLTTAIDRFADDGTRCVTVADTLGFPLAANGNDAVGLAAYAALLMESATKSRQFLPVAAPTGIEVVDQHGTRVSVWTFDVDGERLLLANLAITPVDSSRVETTLADLSAILTPSHQVSYT